MASGHHPLLTIGRSKGYGVGVREEGSTSCYEVYSYETGVGAVPGIRDMVLDRNRAKSMVGKLKEAGYDAILLRFDPEGSRLSSAVDSVIMGI